MIFNDDNNKRIGDNIITSTETNRMYEKERRIKGKRKKRETKDIYNRIYINTKLFCNGIIIELLISCSVIYLYVRVLYILK